MKKILFFFTFLVFISNIYSSGGSLYTRYGIGDLYYSGTSYKLSLGGAGTSLSDEKYVNLNNPATWNSIKNVRFGTSLISNSSIIDDGIENVTYTHVRFSGFHIAFPVKESLGIGFVFGMTPYSVVNYEVINKVSQEDIDNYDEIYEGSGGLSKLFFGVSYKLPFDISLGATFDYYTGSFKYKSSFIFEESTLTNSFFDTEFDYKGLGGTFGLESPDLATVFKLNNISNFRFGLTYEFSGKINTDTSLVALTTLGENEFESAKVKTDLPHKIGAGLNFTINEKYLVVLDYLYQPWSKYEQNGLKTDYLRDLSRYSIGFEYGEQVKRFASFWELIRYRGGLSFEQSQYDINGEGINQLGIHAGISLPLGLENTIDIGFMYGSRGSTDSNLLKENIFQASVSLNFGEFWFVRRDR